MDSNDGDWIDRLVKDRQRANAAELEAERAAEQARGELRRVVERDGARLMNELFMAIQQLATRYNAAAGNQVVAAEQVPNGIRIEKTLYPAGYAAIQLEREVGLLSTRFQFTPTAGSSMSGAPRGSYRMRMGTAGLEFSDGTKTLTAAAVADALMRDFFPKIT
jgi:hypothetical protein